MKVIDHKKNAKQLVGYLFNKKEIKDRDKNNLTNQT